MPVLRIGLNYRTKFFSALHPLFFLLISLPTLSLHCWSSGAISPSDPAPLRGRVAPSASSAPGLFSGAPPQRSFPSWGPLTLTQILLEEKRHSPERVARNHARVEQVVLFQVDRKHHQEFRAVLFPFFREDLHRFPVGVQAVSPYQRKTTRPMGS